MIPLNVSIQKNVDVLSLLQPIKYVQLPPPKTDSVSQQTIYDFFKGAVSSDDVGPIVVIIKSNHSVGEFKLARSSAKSHNYREGQENDRGNKADRQARRAEEMGKG
jgi:hypothetical protein